MKLKYALNFKSLLIILSSVFLVDYILDYISIKLLIFPENYAQLFGIITLIYLIVYLAVTTKTRDKISIILSMVSIIVMVLWMTTTGPLILPA